MSVRILIMAGGTGGHIFPALAVARELSARGAEVAWLGTRRGMEARLVPAAGFPIHYIDVAGLRGNGLRGWLLAPLRVSRALWQAWRVVRRTGAQAVLGMGGFVTGPGGLAARIAGRPLLIHEQNAVAGLTNRLLRPLAQRVLCAFPAAFAGAEVVGNPVRGEIAALEAPASRYARHDGALRVLVVGGSLGAQALNQTLPRALALMAPEWRPQVRHQCGEKTAEQTRELYAQLQLDASVEPFIDDMAAAYEWADLVLCRAGALTVSELAAVGIPAVLVPLPHAVDDHQSRNAAYLVDAGAAWLLPQGDMTPDSLAALLGPFCSDPQQGRQGLLVMAAKARAMARTEAAQRVAQYCLDAAGGAL